jgi:hypothetical protein
MATPLIIAYLIFVGEHQNRMLKIQLDMEQQLVYVMEKEQLRQS